MPARYIKSYKYVAPDGVEFDSLDDEQRHEILALFPNPSGELVDANALTDFLIENRTKLVEILNQRERKRQSPERKAKRGRKAATPEPATV